MRYLNWWRAPLLVALGAALVLLAYVAATDTREAVGASAFDIAVSAEVLEADAPVDIDATSVAIDAQGQPAHGVRVTWRGDEPAMLDDVRFTHHVPAEDGAGDLVTAGRGCGADWVEESGEVAHFCTLDFQIIELAAGETHEYPVRIYPEVGPLTLAAGTYVLDQTVAWWPPDDEQDRSEFTVRLTYEVTERITELVISVEAEIVESSPARVAATAVGEQDGLPAHGVRVTWQGSENVVLADARFNHHATDGDGDGDLITAGRGCGVHWDEDFGLAHNCTDDLHIIEVGFGDVHEYPVRIHPEVGPLALAEGTYSVEETIDWHSPDEGGPSGQFTIRLTYTVTPVPAGAGVLTPDPAPSGVTLATWSGGPIASLPPAAAYWMTHQGGFVGYVPNAPQFVNAEFLALFPGGHMPAGTGLVVVR